MAVREDAEAVLHIHRAERADALVAALTALLARPADGDPFAPEVVCVPTRGMERWLTQRMSTGLGATPGRADGICANVEMPTPRRLLEDAVALATGIDPEADAWLPERLVWPLLEVVDGALQEPWLRSLAAHLGQTLDNADPARQARRFASVRHVADLFDRYAVQRPTMVRAWAAGRDRDAAGAPLAADARWQAELWRRLRERVAQPDPAERAAAATAALRERPELAALPPRVAMFGLTRLPAARLEVLQALAAHRDVHLFLLHPSPGLWEKVEGARPVVRRADDPTRALRANRLLASWGQDVHELQLVLGAAADVQHHHPAPAGGDTLLGRVQADVRGDRRPPGPPLPGEPDERLRLDGDASVRVHACHGRARQVEVLRDAILHLLAEDPTLEPRDVIVMCPDIEAFAPLIAATFGAGEVAPGDDERDALPEELRPPDLRVRLADRALRQTNPLLGFVARALELADQRLTASQVLDLADREPVRRRFGLDDDDLARVEEWVSASGIRWGLDGPHRAPFRLDRLPAGTWRAGLDRVLLGVAMTEDEQRLFGGVLPLDDVDSGAIELAGRLAELLDRLQAALDGMREPMTIDRWAAAIGAAADALTATGARDAWQRAELQRLLDDVVAEAEVSGAAGITLALAEVRALLAGRLEGRPTRANFRTGHLTICTLVPMRSVPHRVVCLLGLDDGEFPRKTPRDGDDLVLRDPHVGDRDARAEDRQMLLDALMAATDRLIVTYTGKDERTNTPRPPAVPVGELLDVLDATAIDARAHVLVEHPLQPFDPRNFTRGALVPGRPWGFDRVTLAGARALEGPRADPPPFLAGPLPEIASPLVELDDLVRFAEHPVRAFLRQRMGLVLGDFSEEVADALTVEVDGLEAWRVATRLLEGRLAGATMDRCEAAELARGQLPPGRLGTAVLARLRPAVEEIAARAGTLAGGEAGAVDVRVALGGCVLAGTVGGVHGDLLRTVTYSRVNARHRIAQYVRWLALSAAHPERAFEAALVGRGDDGVAVVRLGPIEAGAARERLGRLLALHRRGLREPLPLATATAAAFLEHGEAAARRAWESTWAVPHEDADPEHQLVFGGVLPFARLCDTRFPALARELWTDVLAAEAS